MSFASPGSDAATHASQRESLDYLASELVDYQPDIRDDALRSSVNEWILEYRDLPVGDVEERVADTLAEIRADHAMYRTPRTEDGTTEFPDRCRGCPHYGTACPVLTDNDQIRRRKRIMDDADSAKDLRRRLQEYAIDNSCDVLQTEVGKIRSTHEPLIRRGFVLALVCAERLLHGSDDAYIAKTLARADSAAEIDVGGLDLGLDVDLGAVDRDAIDEIAAEAANGTGGQA